MQDKVNAKVNKCKGKCKGRYQKMNNALTQKKTRSKKNNLNLTSVVVDLLRLCKKTFYNVRYRYKLTTTITVITIADKNRLN